MLGNVIPLYPLYALLFLHAGLTVSEVTALFAVWSLVGIVAEVPTGALADRFSRRGALVVAGILQAGGYALWITLPGFTGFAVGFVAWGLAGSLVSGAFEALLYDGLTAADAAEQFPAVFGRATAAGLAAQLPAAVAATVLFAAGGYPLVGWVSVGFCLVAAGLATRFPDPPRTSAGDVEGGDNFFAVLRAGVVEAAARPAVRAAVVAVALLTAVDAIEEYFPVLAHDWGVATVALPLAVLAIPIAGAAFAASAGAARRLRPWQLSAAVGVAALVLGAAGLLRQPAGLAGVALFYGLYRMVLVVTETRLQESIDGPARATVTSVAALCADIASFGLYAAWVGGGVLLVAALLAVLAFTLPALLRERG